MSIHCDYCNKEIEWTAVDLSFGYGSLLDGNNFVFCTDKCLKDFVLKEVNITNDEKSTKSLPEELNDAIEDVNRGDYLTEEEFVKKHGLSTKNEVIYGKEEDKSYNCFQCGKNNTVTHLGLICQECVEKSTLSAPNNQVNVLERLNKIKFDSTYLLGHFNAKNLNSDDLRKHRQLITDLIEDIKDYGVNYEKNTKNEVNSLVKIDIRQKESLSELGENPNANIHSQNKELLDKDYVKTMEGEEK